MRNIVGQVARGEDFFPRPLERKEIEISLSNGSNILLTAPRRVGKTSILYNLLESTHSYFAYHYVITESVRSADDFYNRLIIVLYESMSGPLRKTMDSVAEFIKQIESVDVLGTSVKRSRDQSSKNRNTILRTLINKLIDKGQRLVVMIDEFPQAIVNISTDKGDDKAIEFLQELRELRHETKYQSKLQFIFTGSIGLENVVSKLDSIYTINDLTVIKVGPLERDKAAAMVTALANKMEMSLSTKNINDIIKLVEWLIPFHIQVFMQELGVQNKSKSRNINAKTFAIVIDEIVKNKVYFEHWRIRLKGMMLLSEFAMAERLLSETSKMEYITREEIFKLINGKKPSVRRKKQGATMRLNRILDILIHDGYLHTLTGDPPRYSFISPFLKTWWRRSIAV